VPPSTDLFIDFFNEIDLPAMLTAFDAKLTLVMPVNTNRTALIKFNE